jgi:hypothetical protein
MQQSTFWEFVWKSAEAVPGALLGAFAGAGFAMWFASIERRKSLQLSTTQNLVDDLMSPSFLPHRIALGKLNEEFLADSENGDLINRFAEGFWYPGGKNEYTGAEPYEGLTLHEHFEAALGWVKRAAQAKRSNLLNEEDFAYVLRDAFSWLDAVFYPVAQSVILQTEQYKQSGNNPQAFSWVDDLNLVRSIFRSYPARKVS